MIPRLTGINLFIIHIDSEGQEFRQGTAEIICVCSITLRTQLGRLEWLRMTWCLRAGIIRSIFTPMMEAWAGMA